jgi:hypothetical protein
MSRRTIVVFHLPTNELMYLELGDLVNSPEVGVQYTFEGVRYRVTDVTETIGEFEANGTRRTGFDKLLELLAVSFDLESLRLLARMRNIGSGDQPEKAPIGGILLPPKSMFGNFDHAVLVELKAVGSKATSTLLSQLRQIAGGASFEMNAAVAATGSPPIRVGEEAAGS